MMFIAVVLALGAFATPAAATRSGAIKGLKVGYYSKTCPRVEQIVYDSMRESYRNDATVAPAVLRLAFHDCFVRGCDASVLLVGPNTERTAVDNRGLRHFEAVDVAKRAVESACPGVVSAADVLQFAARDAVVLAGGRTWRVPAGRRDGTVSSAEEAQANLPTATMTAAQLVAVFRAKGLSAKQLVVLSGAHTIGRSPCLQFDNRVQVSPVDPTLAPGFASSLRTQCPHANMTTLVNLDSTVAKFDTQYFKDVVRGRGLLTSDQTLLSDSRTRSAVYSNQGAEFYDNFGKAMVAMSKIGVLTGTHGEIRRLSQYVN